MRPSTARTAGIAGLLGSLLAAAFKAYELLTLPAEVTPATAVFYALVHLAAVAALCGLAALGATGPAWWGRAGIGVAVLGFLALTVGELLDLLDPAAAGPFFEIGALLLGIGLLAAGVAVLRAGRCTGWRRFFPLVCGVYVFVVYLPVALLAGDPGIWTALIGWFLTTAALGLAVVVESATAVEAPERSRVA